MGRIGSQGNFAHGAGLDAGIMIIGLGTDLVEVARIRESMERFGERFMVRVFTPQERAYCDSKADPAIHYAARFAAKEACAKALGSGIAGGLNWADMEVTRNETGRPGMELTGKAREAAALLAVTTIHVTLTHTTNYASATVLLEG